ncbi:MAG TPA: lysoplasmalogenase [Clostridia bacterium]|jgi:uncharacterized membrane protein YhhN|nr:lysoplasmalogenase [Clostridia bacterium]
MNIAAYITACLSVVSGVLSGYFNRQNKPMLRTSFKTLGSSLFIATALLAFFSRGEFNSYFLFVVIALFAGMLGDIFLSQDGLVKEQYKPYFIAIGATCFAVGHVLFSIIFIYVAKSFNFWLLFIPLIVLALFIAVTIVFKFKLGKLRIPSYAYALFLSVMLIAGINMFITNTSSVFSILALVAAILFVISDTIMGFKKFTDNEHNPFHVYSILITYYTAQNLFALSILFFLK